MSMQPRILHPVDVDSDLCEVLHFRDFLLGCAPKIETEWREPFVYIPFFLGSDVVVLDMEMFDKIEILL